jgi:hypothetical protein
MTAPSNLSFETAGTNPGDAQDWTRTSTSSASGFGSYAYTASGRTRRADGFEAQWGGTLTASFTSDGSAVLASAGHPFTVVDHEDKDQCLILVGSAPSPLTVSSAPMNHGAQDLSYIYYLVDVVPGVSFGLSTTPGGSAMNVAAGSGTVREPTNEWYLRSFAGGGTVPHLLETFDWHPDYVFESPNVNVSVGYYNALYVLPNGTPYDRFDVGWGLDNYRFNGRDPGDITAGTYDSTSAQQADNWLASLANYRFSGRDPGDVTTGQYPNAPGAPDLPAEVFLAVSDAEFVALSGDPDLQSTNPPAVDTSLLFSSTDTLPGGFSTSTTYVVISSGSGVFQVSTSSGGPAVTPTDSGSGTHSLTADTRYCWKAMS